MTGAQLVTLGELAKVHPGERWDAYEKPGAVHVYALNTQRAWRVLPDGTLREMPSHRLYKHGQQ